MSSVNGYTIEKELARGGAGVVFRARSPSGERVALKVLMQGGSAGNVARFRREVTALSGLDHPGIVRLRDAGVTDLGQRYLVLDYVEGETLAARLERGALPVSYAVELVSEVARALQVAHEQGILHRDVKPANVLLDPAGRPRLTDFGLAVEADGQHSLTKTGAMLGTPGYMPPEQGMGELEKLGPAADVYALGATLYACLCGRPPFDGEPLQVLAATADQVPELPSTHRPQVHPELDAICLRCLEKDPSQRYPDAGALAEVLEGFLSGEPSGARPYPQASSSKAWLLFPLVAVASVVLAVAVWSQRQGETPVDPPPPPPPPVVSYAPASPDPEVFAQLNAYEQDENPIAALELSEPLLERFPDHPQLMAHVGRERCMLDQTELGMPLLERAVELEPESADAWRFLAIANLGVDPARSLAAIECSLELKETPEAYAVRARALLYSGDATQAERDLDRAEALDPTYRHLKTTRAVVLFGQGRFSEGMELLEEEIAREPTASRFLMRAQILRARKAPPEQQLRDLDAALARREFPQALQAKATVLEELERLEEAEGYWTRYLAFKPRSTPALCKRALVRARLDRDPEALEDAELARSLKPTDFEARHNLALAFHYAGRDQTSLELLEPLIEERPARYLYALRAQLRYNLVDYDGAYADAMHCLREDPENLMALELAALSATLQARPDATELARRLVRAHPKPERVFQNLLTALWHEQGFAEMLEISEERGLETLSPYALAYRGAAFLGLGREEEAAGALNQALERDPRCKPALVFRTELYLALEDFPRALTDIDAFVTIAPGSCSGYQMRAAVRMGLGDLAGARADLDEFERLGPSQMRQAAFGSRLKELRARLAKLEGH